jgi:hypothetical protein
MKQIKVIFIFALVLVCAVLLGMTPGSAQAAPLLSSWFFEDDMESGLSQWDCWGSGGNFCMYLSASNNNTSILLDAYNGFETVGRRVTISPFVSGMSCKATMFFKPYTHPGYSTTPPYSGQLEVIDYNTWTYNKIKTFTYIYVPFNGGWNTVTTASWTPPRPDIFVRMVFNNPTTTSKILDVDLLRVSCTW